MSKQTLPRSDNESRAGIETQYIQMHETKRQWERFIWQSPILMATIVGGIYAIAASGRGYAIFQDSIWNLLATGFLAFFGFALTFRTHRSRLLLRNIERELSRLEEANFSQIFDKYPHQLNKNLTGINNISSTKFMVWFLVSVSIFLTVLFLLNIWKMIS